MQNGVPQNPGELNKRVETLAADLMSKGYWLFVINIVINLLDYLKLHE